MGLRVTRQGISTSIVDGGRKGFGHLGVNPDGPMDPVAYAVSNFIVGNESAASLECFYPFPGFVAEKETLISVCGHQLQLLVNGKEQGMWRPIRLFKGDKIELKGDKKSRLAYISVSSGFKIEKVMGSFTTSRLAAFGGFNGRNIKKGDVLESYENISLPEKQPSWGVNYLELYANSGSVIRFTTGTEWDWLTDEAKCVFNREVFIKEPESDRMAMHLNHAPLSNNNSQNLISSMVTYGTVQLLPSGKIMLLMAGHQVTGGYPRIAQVIACDLPQLATAPIGSGIRFSLIKTAVAINLLSKLNDKLDEIKEGCFKNLNTWMQRG